MKPSEVIARVCLNAYNRAGCGPTGIDAAIGAVDVELRRLSMTLPRGWHLHVRGKPCATCDAQMILASGKEPGEAPPKAKAKPRRK